MKEQLSMTDKAANAAMESIQKSVKVTKVMGQTLWHEAFRRPNPYQPGVASILLLRLAKKGGPITAGFMKEFLGPETIISNTK